MITRDNAFTLLKKYNQDPFHIQHALTVETVIKWYANELGYIWKFTVSPQYTRSDRITVAFISFLWYNYNILNY